MAVSNPRGATSGTGPGFQPSQRESLEVTPPVPVTFQLYRRHDVSRVSGCGVVADGTWYPNGKVSLAWRGSRTSINFYESLADVVAIHGHNGSTQLIPYGEPPQAWYTYHALHGTPSMMVTTCPDSRPDME